MSRIAYVNGRYVFQKDASINIEDRGYQFSDGVYEVIAVFRGKLVDCGGPISLFSLDFSHFCCVSCQTDG